MKKILFLFVANLFVMNELNAQTQQQEYVVDVIQKRAEFPGGNTEYKKFFETNLRYPSEAQKKGKEGTVYVKFIVDKDGSIMKDCVKVAKSVDIDLDAEAIRVVKMFPNWTPAMQNERPTKQRIRVPVKFKISK